MKGIEIKEHIEQITKVNEAFWQVLQNNIVASFLEKGTLYAKEGSRVKSIGFLKSGIIRIYYLDENGNEWNKAFLEKNSFLLGNVNIEEKITVYYETLTACEILKAPISFYQDSMKNYPNLNKVFQHHMALLLKRKSEREIDFLRLTAEKRYQKFKATYPHLLKIIPQYHIASFLGITPTQLSRIKLSA